MCVYVEQEREGETEIKMQIKNVFNEDEEGGVWNGCRKCIGFALNYQLDDSFFTRILFFNLNSSMSRECRRARVKSLCLQRHNGHFSIVHVLDFSPF